MPSDSKPTADSAPRPMAGKADSVAERQERLAQALRDNLRKRKAQQRQRREGAPGGHGGDNGADGEGA